MTINSDQVNYLVLRYLNESGFEHTAFTLRNEMRNAVDLDRAWATRVPTGHLVNSLQRALMFEECMAQIDENGLEKDEADVVPASLIPNAGSKPDIDRPSTEAALRDTPEKPSQKNKSRNAAIHTEAPADLNGSANDTVMTDVSAPTLEQNPVGTIKNVLPLEGHTEGLDQCVWHPVQQSLLATSSLDGTARIWNLPSRAEDKATSIVLNCTPCRTKDKSVTSVAWSKNGQSVATGSYDGVTRIWTSTGVKQHRDLTFHTGPIFAMKWSRRSDFLLTGAADGLVGVWNTSLGNLQQKWDLRSPVMDLEWISDALFLSACKDGSLKMWQLSRDHHIKRFAGHTGDINVLKWNSNINLGATGGDDHIVKVWRADSETPTQVLRFHKHAVQSLEWAPKDYGDYRLLASAASDGLVCIWDVVRGELLHVLQHDRAIFTLHFSPTNMLATGGDDGVTSVWNPESGKMIALHHSQRAFGRIYNVKFSNNGERIAVARANAVGMILDMPAK